MKKTIFRTIILLTVLSAGLITYAYMQVFSALTSEDKLVYIPSGANYEDVKDSLFVNDLLKNESVFDLLCSKKQYINIHPGRYLISAGMNANEMVNRLRLGEQEPLNIIFNNASTIQDLAGKIAVQIEADSLSLLQEFSSPLFFETYGFDEASIRKLFIPNTYQVYWTISPIEFLERMQKEYNRFWTEERISKAKRKGLTPHEVSVLASVVQKESSKADEQPLVAGLYLNRLKRGMKLQSDPTVIYAIKERDGFDTVIKRVLKKDLKVDSPYNTYQYKGLPPNPICIPEMSALQSVLDAKSHNYIYMCAKEDFSGYHNFTQSWSEHKRNAKKFQRALSEKGVMR